MAFGELNEIERQMNAMKMQDQGQLSNLLFGIQTFYLLKFEIVEVFPFTFM